MSILKKILNLFTDKLVLLWLFLTGVVVAGGIFGYNWWEKRQAQKQFEQQQADIFNVQDKRPTESNKKYEDTHSRIIGNQRRAKKLASKIEEDTTNSQWKEVIEKIKSSLKTVQDLRKVSREGEEELEKLWVEVYQQEVTISRLSEEVIKVEETKQQIEFQEQWLKDIKKHEQEAFEPIRELIDHFYHRFLEQLKENEKTPWNIEVLAVQGQKVNPEDPDTRKSHIDYILTKNYLVGGERIRPLTSEWRGFTGFLQDDTEASKKEGKNTMGLTTCEIIVVGNKELDNGKLVNIYEDNVFRYSNKPAGPKIELKKELLLSRQNRYYDEWLSELKTNEKVQYAWYSLDISEENLVNTIAHELAHAVINTNYFSYQDENGGHGTLHDEYTDQIEEMIKSDKARYDAFMAWWREPQTKNG